MSLLFVVGDGIEPNDLYEYIGECYGASPKSGRHGHRILISFATTAFQLPQGFQYRSADTVNRSNARRTALAVPFWSN
jgi:hypothetical protein